MGSEIEKPFLPLEIIINILTWLPIKSIVQFQCVCKDWKDLFKTQSFISQHTLHHFALENPFLLIHAYDPNHQRSTLRFLDQKMELAEVLNTSLIDSFRRRWKIIGSSNGLLCVELDTDRGRYPSSYLLWNPMINEVREVPHLLDDYGKASKLGFGYSGVVDDYKLVRFYNPHLFSEREAKIFGTKSLCCVQVYSLNTGSWKELKMVKDLQHVEIYAEAAHVNGTIFWKGIGSPFEMLIAFDIATEVFTITPMHTLLANMGGKWYVNCPSRPYEYGNKLAMYDYYSLYMWVIEEGANESGKRYCCTERYEVRTILSGFKPFCIWRNQIVYHHEYSQYALREDEFEREEKKYLQLFNLTTKEWEKLPTFSGAYVCCTIFNYKKSLCACLRHLR